MIAPTIPDTREVLQSTADYLFDVSRHLASCGRHHDSYTMIRSAVEIAIRAAYLRCGKQACVLATEKVLHVLRSNGTLDKQSHRSVVRMLQGETVTTPAMNRLMGRLQQRSMPLNLDEVGPPRQRDEARQVYKGVTQPHPDCRSVVSRRRPYQEKTTA